jgi:multidrug efflux pump subunit AcrB
VWIGDYSLNLLTVAVLTMAVGRVVDDSIVVPGDDQAAFGIRRAEGARHHAAAIAAGVLIVVCAVLLHVGEWD